MKVVIDMPIFRPLLDKLSSLPGIDIKQVMSPEEKPRPLPIDLIADCEVLFCTYPPENHNEMQKLKLIQISSAGYSQLVGKGFEERNVRACNAAGESDIPIAEWNIAMMINLARNLRKMIHNQEVKLWDRSSRFQTEIKGSVVGILGYGGIGRQTARLAKALGMKVHVMDQNKIGNRSNVYMVAGTGDKEGKLPDRVFSLNQMKEFLIDLDFLILGVPLTAATTGIIGEEELKTLPSRAYLLNPARGPLVQEYALIRALEKGWIAGAALDTHYHYPMPSNHPLWKMKNVIMTPHISGSSSSPKFLERVWDIFVNNVTCLQGGGSLLNELTAKQLKG